MTTHNKQAKREGKLTLLSSEPKTQNTNVVVSLIACATLQRKLKRSEQSHGVVVAAAAVALLAWLLGVVQ